MKEEELRKKIEEIMLASTPEDVGYHADKIIQLMKSSQDEIIKGYKIQLKTAWEQIDILKAEQEKNYISIEEHNKVIDKTKECIRAEQEKERKCQSVGCGFPATRCYTCLTEFAYECEKNALKVGKKQERQALLAKIDKVVDEWTETYWGNVNYGMKENLKQKLKEAVRKCLTKKSEIKCWKN